MEPRPLSSEERPGYSRTPSIVSVTLISKGCFTSFVAWSFLLSPARPVARVVWGRTEPSWRSCHRGERLVDLSFEYAERLGTPQHLDLLHLVTLTHPQQHGRGARDPELLALGDILAHPFGVSATVQAVLEGGRLRPERLGMLGKPLRRQRLLVGEQPAVHLPVLLLLPRAVRRLGGLEGLRVDRLQREVVEYVAHLAGADRQRLCHRCVVARLQT